MCRDPHLCVRMSRTPRSGKPCEDAETSMTLGTQHGWPSVETHEVRSQNELYAVLWLIHNDVIAFLTFKTSLGRGRLPVDASTLHKPTMTHHSPSPHQQAPGFATSPASANVPTVLVISQGRTIHTSQFAGQTNDHR